jgi:hypothetical protein
MNVLLQKYIDTWWLAPAAALVCYILFMASLMLQLNLLPYVLFWMWVMAAMAQAFVVVVQFFRDEFRTGFVSTALLIIPAVCFVMLADQ